MTKMLNQEILFRLISAQVLFNVIRKGSLIFRGFEWPKSMVINMSLRHPFASAPRVPLRIIGCRNQGLIIAKTRRGSPLDSESKLIYGPTKLAGICLSVCYVDAFTALLAWGLRGGRHFFLITKTNHSSSYTTPLECCNNRRGPSYSNDL